MTLIKKAVYIERAPAKVNLFLNILGKREDNYHNLETVFQAINLEDHLTLSIQVELIEEEGVISDHIEFEIEIDSTSEEIKALGLGNSVAKAIEIYFTEVPQEQIIDLINKVNIDVFIDKNIPPQAGLAGGSADAAATLRALNKFFLENFNWSLSQKELLRLAAEIGSDVPFCLQALEQPRIYAESTGDIFIDKTIDFGFDDYKQMIIVKPQFGISTKEAYQLYDSRSNDKQSKKQIGFYNSFEDSIFDNYPQLLEIQEELANLGCDHILLSGSGSAMIGFVNSSKDIKPIYRSAIDRLQDCNVYTANFLN